MAMKRKREGEKGFTLIEVMVVLAVIVTIAAIALPIFSGRARPRRQRPVWRI